MKNWYRRWMLRRIILALQTACEHHGLKPEVFRFAAAMEATNSMVGGMKKDTEVTLTVTKEELQTFLSYMIQLHNSKLSLLTRARIGLVTLLIDDRKLMPRGPDGKSMDPMDFASEQFGQAKHSKDDRRIQTLK